MAVLIFVGMALALRGGIATGPNEWVSCGLTNWLELHRYMDHWSVEHVHLARMVLEGGVAVGLTWLFSQILHANRKSA
jgi:hypothetical protein